MGCLEAVLGNFETILGRLEALLALLGGYLGPYWAILGPPTAVRVAGIRVLPRFCRAPPAVRPGLEPDLEGTPRGNTKREPLRKVGI